MVGKIIRSLQILAKLGEGGIGVCKAREMYLDRFMALTVLRTEKVLGAQCKARFVQEAQAAGTLNLLNVVAIRDSPLAEGFQLVRRRLDWWREERSWRNCHASVGPGWSFLAYWVLVGGAGLRPGLHHLDNRGWCATTDTCGGNDGINRLAVGVTVDATGNVYFASANYCVFKLDTAGILRLVAGNSRAGYSGDGGPATSAQIHFAGFAAGVAVDGTGNVYIADTSNHRIRRVSP